MGGPGDRAAAGLLSALAEAPDVSAAASFFLTHLVDITGASKACVLRLDAAREHLQLIAAHAFVTELPPIGIPIADLSNPLVISALTLAPVTGTTPLPERTFASIVPWIALPLSQPRFRGSPEMISV